MQVLLKDLLSTKLSDPDCLIIYRLLNDCQSASRSCAASFIRSVLCAVAVKEADLKSLEPLYEAVLKVEIGRAHV